jgi:hypothetical protein
MPSKMTYKAAGVDIALKQSLIPLFGSIAKSTSPSGSWPASGFTHDSRSR